MRWTLGLQGAPRRVNHAAAAIGDDILSFGMLFTLHFNISFLFVLGGYCTGEDYRFHRPIDVHKLNTQTLTWSLIPNNVRCEASAVPFQRYGHTG